MIQRRQNGSMLVLALFVIVVMAFLGLTLTKLMSTSSDAIIHEVLGQRALNAARTGIECRLATTFPISAAITPYCSDPDSKGFVGVAGLENCAYVTSQVEKTVVDGTLTQSYQQFSSTGQCTAGKIVVSRTVYIDAML